MVKAAEDLNSQLYLLPHTAPADITNANGQLYLLPPDKHIEGRYPGQFVPRTNTLKNY